jgi:hypothetical protein
LSSVDGSKYEPIRRQRDIKGRNNMEKLINALKQLSKDHPEGFTVDLDLTNLTEGYVIALPETQGSFGNEGLEKVVRFAAKNSYNIGGWLGPNNKFYWDASIIVGDREEAIALGRKFNQLAIFDLNRQETIWL